MKKIFSFFTFLIALSAGSQVHAQLTITTAQTADQLASILVGSGVAYSNATMICANSAQGKFTNVNTTLVGIDSGILLTSGDAAIVAGPEFGIQTGVTNTGSDIDLDLLSGFTTYDKCVLEFDFVPQGDSIKFDYIFGSDEHPDYWCSTVNDVFGFFITGPGYTSPTNIALVPGTNIAVSINSVNGSTNPGPLCTQLGVGSPFTQYYTSNAGSTTVCYGGFTHLFQALAAVTPCDTYHLKLAIADGGDAIFDSGVFLKAGSLSSNTVSVESIGGGGLLAPEPYCVRDCLPGEFVFHLGQPAFQDYVIRFDIGGTAVMGYDYTPIPDSVVIPAGDTTVSLFIYGLPVPPQGPKTVELYIISPYACNGSNYVDTAVLTIYDSLFARIITPDTAICRFESVQIQSQADTLLSILWTPGTTLSNDTILNPVATPTATTTYTMIASLPGSGCAPVHNSITISIADEPIVDVGPDLTICLGSSHQFNPTVTPNNQSYAFSWTPATDLDNPNIPNPTTTPQNDITYYIMVTPTLALCPGYDTVNIDVIPNDFTLENPDTAICKGQSVQVRANGPVEFTFTWTPSTGVSDPFQIDPLITPDTSETYTITSHHPNCTDVTKSFFIDVQPNPQVFLGRDTALCQWDSLHIIADILPEWYTNYSYNWEPQELDSFNQYHVIYHGYEPASAQVILQVSTAAGCTGADTMNITVHQGNFATVTPVTGDLCPRDTLQLTASGAVTYSWTANAGFNSISDPTSPNPTVFPESDVLYTLLATDANGCTDTLTVDVAVHAAAVTTLVDSVTLWPGETYQIELGGNTLYHSWFPPEGLSATNISNPVANPSTYTRYYVEASTEWGCATRDSIDVYLDPNSILDVPNAFTPGVAPNAEFKIVKKGIANLKYFRIFNRWGQVVFETTDINQGWDGTFKGVPQPMGVYVYTVEALTNTYERFVKQGNVTLIR